MTEPAAMLKTTCLHQAHLDLAARMVPFGGWDMPIQYHSILEEHRAVRNAAGMFDVSHMGRVDFHGPDCIAYLQRLFTCDVTKVAPGSARYTLLCVEDGGILDDTNLYCRNPESFVLICNASNTPAVLDWLAQWKRPGEQVAITERTAGNGHDRPARTAGCRTSECPGKPRGGRQAGILHLDGDHGQRLRSASHPHRLHG